MLKKCPGERKVAFTIIYAYITTEIENVFYIHCHKDEVCYIICNRYDKI